MSYIVFTDVEGRPFTVEELDFYKQLQSKSFTLFGMTFPCLLEMRKQYQIRRGPLPPTIEDIRKAFEATGDSDD